jgi:hypothetical protein
VILQLWLLTVTINASLGGKDSIVWPGASRMLLIMLREAPTQ